MRNIFRKRIHARYLCEVNSGVFGQNQDRAEITNGIVFLYDFCTRDKKTRYAVTGISCGTNPGGYFQGEYLTSRITNRKPKHSIP